MEENPVKTIALLAQWSINNFQTSSSFKSAPFKMGRWNWFLKIMKEGYIYLYLETSQNLNPTARMVFRVFSQGIRITTPRYKSPVYDKLLQSNKCDYICWYVGGNNKPYWTVGALGNCIIIEVEFHDLKISPSNGKEAISIWPGDRISTLCSSDHLCFSRMLNEAIHTDVTIKTEDGTLRAHKAVLSASSPVFESMFTHNFKEKESSIIDIQDMSHESCMAFLQYLYGTIKVDQLWKHRLVLLRVANKYDIPKLKDICEESLLEDLNLENVLERLQDAWFYQLNKLKKGCFSYLFDFHKIHDLKDKIVDSLREADKELILDVFQKSTALWMSA